MFIASGITSYPVKILGRYNDIKNGFIRNLKNLLYNDSYNIYEEIEKIVKSPKVKNENAKNIMNKENYLYISSDKPTKKYGLYSENEVLAALEGIRDILGQRVDFMKDKIIWGN